MADRIKAMRAQLFQALKDVGAPGKWDHIVNQIGMFSYTGLSKVCGVYVGSKWRLGWHEDQMALLLRGMTNGFGVAKVQSDDDFGWPDNGALSVCCKICCCCLSKGCRCRESGMLRKKTV